MKLHLHKWERDGHKPAPHGCRRVRCVKCGKSAFKPVDRIKVLNG